MFKWITQDGFDDGTIIYAYGRVSAVGLLIDPFVSIQEVRGKWHLYPGSQKFDTEQEARSAAEHKIKVFYE